VAGFPRSHELLWCAEDASQLSKESQQAKGRRWSGRATAVGTKWHLMAGNGGKLGRKQEEAIVALLSQRNIEDAARAAGVGARTLIRWLKLPEFQVAYREARRAGFSQSIARLQQASSAAATTLLKIMLDVNASASTRVRAADSVLAHAKQAIEIEDIEVRVAALEEAAKTNPR
jgi:hypothetical protein